MEWIAAHCGTGEFAQGGLLASLLLAGMLGSLTHCSTMCGPMVISQMLDPAHETASPHLRLAAYHAGRLTTYSLLGLMAGLAGGWLLGNPMFSSLSGMALLAAGLVFLHSALWPQPAKSCQCDSRKGIFGTVQALKAPYFIKGYLRGVLLGFMPCGLLLAALLLAATAATPLLAALGMAVFGLGTMPLLHAIGLGVRRLWPREGRLSQYIGKGAMTLNGLVLCGLGLWQFH